MKTRINQKVVKRITALLIIFILTAGIELLYNFRALKYGYEPLDLTGSMEVIEDDNGNEKYVISYKSKKGIYVDQLKVNGLFDSTYSYSIIITGKNDFDIEEEKYIYDSVNSWFSDFYTKIGKKVFTLQFILQKVEDDELRSVSLLNQPEWNKYRMAFWLIVLSLIYCICFEKSIIKHIEYFFLIYGMAFGLLTIFSAQVQRVSWDEQIHFRNVYKVAYGKDLRWTEAAWDIKESNVVSCNTKAEYAQFRNKLNTMGEGYILTEDAQTSLVSYSNLAYIPQAFFFRAGIWAGIPFSLAYEFGKLGNLLLYLLTMFTAIRIAKTKKLFLAFFAMMPTVLFQASSYTYDNVVTCFLTLGSVLWFNEMLETEKKCSSFNIISALLLFVIGSLSKAVYIPIVLLILLLPLFRTGRKRERIILWTTLIAVFLLVMMTFVLPAITNTVAGNLSFGGDSRGGDTSTVRQLISMMKHPVASVRLMFRNIFAFDNFRNLGTSSADRYFFGNLMFLNFASMGVLKDKWCTLLISVFLLLLFRKEESTGSLKRMTLFEKVCVGGILFMIVVLIWLALYLSFTPVGQETIAGVQARYYLPLIYLGTVFIRPEKAYVSISEVTAAKIMGLTVLLMEAMLFYNGMLVGRLF